MLDFTENQYKKLFELAKATDEEVCGFVLFDGSIIEVENISPDKLETFVIHPLDYLKHKKNIKAIYHSHPKGLEPSEEDKIACRRINIPFLIISLPFSVYYITPKEEECLQLDFTDI